MVDKELLERFMLESNRIEGEDRLNPNDSEIIKDIYDTGIISLNDILMFHQMLTNHLNVNWGGKWRTINVRVGSYHPPNWQEVPELISQYWNNFDNFDSWQAHNEFERIHPFQDFNGRMGRLIWLSKAIKEGYKFSISFLHLYYYQTLRHTNKAL